MLVLTFTGLFLVAAREARLRRAERAAASGAKDSSVVG